MFPRDTAHLPDVACAEPAPWRWSKCRNAGVTVQLWPIQWALGRYAWSDPFAWVGTLHLGPFVFQLNCNVGG